MQGFDTTMWLVTIRQDELRQSAARHRLARTVRGRRDRTAARTGRSTRTGGARP